MAPPNLTATGPRRSRTAILVIGMHRSGTSAMAGLLARAGASLPADLMGASPSNELGHFEPIPVANYNDDVLAALGISWSTPFPPDPDLDRAAILERFKTHAREIIRHQYGTADLIVMKEPRVSLLLDLWIEALEAEGYRCVFVVMVRNPHDVSASLLAAHGIVPVHGLLTWATYMVSADLGSRRHPRTFCDYGVLIDSPVKTLEALIHRFGVEGDLSVGAIAGEEDAVVRSDLRHHAAAPRPLPASLAPLAGLADYQQALAAGLHTTVDTPVEVLRWLHTARCLVLPLLDEVRRDAYRLAGLL